ncbi:MAG: hypothetical protein K2O40_04215, partial [Lachnospiraceae bacterium]|nr:hypothetical protein [Lachnospiraceae bacterium]
MKKKSVALMAMAMTAMLSACGERTDLVGEAVIVRDNENRTGCVEGCTCTGCICCGTVLTDSDRSGEESSPASEQEPTT